jgi:hypothetical protein
MNDRQLEDGGIELATVSYSNPLTLALVATALI